jgi:hypothetical protein
MPSALLADNRYQNKNCTTGKAFTTTKTAPNPLSSKPCAAGAGQDTRSSHTRLQNKV